MVVPDAATNAATRECNFDDILRFNRSKYFIPQRYYFWYKAQNNWGDFFKNKRPRKISPAGAFILLANHLNGTWDVGTLGRFLLNSQSKAWLLLRKVVLLRRKTLKRGTI